jgi:hypothetical protein
MFFVIIIRLLLVYLEINPPLSAPIDSLQTILRPLSSESKNHDLFFIKPLFLGLSTCMGVGFFRTSFLINLSCIEDCDSFTFSYSKWIATTSAKTIKWSMRQPLEICIYPWNVSSSSNPYSLLPSSQPITVTKQWKGQDEREKKKGGGA